MTIKRLRHLHPVFVYQRSDFRYSTQKLTFTADFFVTPNIEFHPRLTIFNITKAQYLNIPRQVLEHMAFHLGLAEIPSYWKATCSPKIIVEAGSLDKNQIRWWKNFIIHGLGEFFFTNKIQFLSPNFLTLRSNGKIAAYQPYSIRAKKNRVLVPIGGGKDSVVTLQILRKRFPVSLFILNSTAATDRIIRKNPSLPVIYARRKIDEQLLQLNSQDYLNGHTPFNGYLAFLLALVAALWEAPYIAVSNEASANEGNATFLGETVNHQFSKSFAFEHMFRSYSTKYLLKNVEYFSFLRPLNELQIAKAFSAYPNYYFDIRSCNAGQQRDTWCAKCPKCLFVYSIFHTFLPSSVTQSMFGTDLFDKRSLLPIAKQLLGESTHKPLECVGTYGESLAAWYLSLKKMKKEGTKIPHLMSYFSRKIVPKHRNIDLLSNTELHKWNTDHKLPTKFLGILKGSITKLL